MSEQGWSVDLGGGKRVEFPPFPPIPRIPRGAARIVLIAAAVLLFAATGYYQVEPDEVGVVQRFGAYVRTSEPGPPPARCRSESSTVTKVPVQRQLKMEFGFRTAHARGADDVSRADEGDASPNR